MQGDRQSEIASLEQRLLLLPPTQRDAEAILQVLAQEQIACLVCKSMADLCEEVKRGAGLVILSEESLVSESQKYVNCMRDQPLWSDMPAIVLSRPGSEAQSLSQFLGRAGNVSVVERPVRVTTLLSLVRSALRGRRRQYQVRDHVTELAKANHMKDEFLATLSHELRTPLSAIMGWARILTTHRCSPEDMTNGLQVIERNARAQNQIIADLLDMSRIISGKVLLNVQEVDLAAVVQAAVDTVKLAAEAKGIRLQLALEPISERMYGDSNRLQQVFWNLLSNAVKFTPEGQLIQVVMRRARTHAEVSIIDSGEGIHSHFLPHVFDRFRQSDASTTRRHGGLGLGLAIVKQLVELHGGTVRVKSEGVGKGAAFTVSLPITASPSLLHQARADSRRTTIAPAPPRSSHEIAGVKVLVVDDETDSRELLRTILENGDANVIAASSAQEAMQLLKAERPDVVVSDIGMPGEDGYSLIRRIRALPPAEGGATSAVAVTAYARVEDRARAMEAGYQLHIAKPVEGLELVAAVAQVSRRRA